MKSAKETGLQLSLRVKVGVMDDPEEIRQMRSRML